MNKISIIIPIYNVGGDLLDRCLSSVTKCISLYRNIIVILVNDYSPKWDEESRVIYNYFNEPIIISHTFNRGLGAARNSGINKALELDADWIWFIDSDDSINPGVILNIVKDIKEVNCNIIQLGMNNVSSSGSKPAYISENPRFSTMSGVNALYHTECIPPSACCKLYNLNFLISNSILFPEGTYYEDQEFLVDSMSISNCNVLVDTKTLAYNYHFNSNSIMNSNWDEKHVLDAWKVVYTCRKKLTNLTNKLNFDYTTRFKEYEYTENLGNEAYNKLSRFSKIKCKIKYLIWRIFQ